MIRILPEARNELSDFSREMREDLVDALFKLHGGERLKPPLSRPMPMIARGVYELRLIHGEVRHLVYYMVDAENIVVLSAFMTKSRQTSFQFIEIVRNRIPRIS